MEKEGDSLDYLLSLWVVLFLFTSMFFLPIVPSDQNPTRDSPERQYELSSDNTFESISNDSGIEFSDNDAKQTTSGEDVDIMIAYTSEAESWASSNDGGIQNTIDEAIGNANTAMENSDIDLDINLAHSSEVDYTETGDDFSTDLQRLEREYDGYMEGIHDLRDYYGADLVSLLVRKDEDSNIAGVARAPHFESQLTPDYAFSVVSVQDISSRYVFTHEIGHNFGAGHAKDQDQNPGPQLYDYSAGWRWRGDKLIYDYVSVMTYREGLNDERVLYFSNPDVYHEGDPTGDPEDGDNARTIRETKDIISDYQEPTPQVDLLYPSGGEELYEGTEKEIEWETTSGDNGVESIDIGLIKEYQENGEIYIEEEIIAEGIEDTGSYVWTVPEDSDSNYQLVVKATDEAGYSRSDTSGQIEILEDNFSPDIEILEPENNQEFESDENVTLRWEGNDDYSGIDHYKIRMDDGEWIYLGQITEYIFEDLDSGQYTVAVQAVDRSDNTANETVEFEVGSESTFDNILDIVGGYFCWFIFFLAAVLLVSLLIAISRGSKQGKPPPGYRSSSVECGRCGAVVSENATTCSNCGVKFKQGIFQCKNCGEWIDANLNKCPKCGTMFRRESSNRTQSKDMTAETRPSGITSTSGKEVETSMSRQPPPPPKKENPCPDCRTELRYIDKYERWYCDSCRGYK